MQEGADKNWLCESFYRLFEIVNSKFNFVTKNLRKDLSEITQPFKEHFP